MADLPSTAKAMLWPLLLLTLLTWALELAGLGALQKICSNNLDSDRNPNNFAWGSNLPYLQGRAKCSQVYRYLWWIVAFELPLWLGIAMTLAMNRLNDFRNSWLALLAVCTALHMWATDVALNLIATMHNGNGQRRAKAMFAGFLATSFLNCLLLFLLGLEQAHRHDPYGTEAAQYETGGPRARGRGLAGMFPGRHAKGVPEDQPAEPPPMGATTTPTHPTTV